MSLASDTNGLTELFLHPILSSRGKYQTPTATFPSSLSLWHHLCPRQFASQPFHLHKHSFAPPNPRQNYFNRIHRLISNLRDKPFNHNDHLVSPSFNKLLNQNLVSLPHQPKPPSHSLFGKPFNMSFRKPFNQDIRIDARPVPHLIFRLL